MRIGLREKILLPVVGLLLLVVVGVGSMALHQAGSLFRERSAQALDQAAHNGADQVDQWFVDRRSQVEVLATLRYLRTAIDDQTTRSDANEQLAGTSRRMAFSQNLNLVDGKGLVVSSSDPARLGKNFADRAYFQKAMGGESNISEPVISKVTGRPVVVVAAPVPGKEGKPDGVVYVSVGMDKFAQQFLKSFSVDSFSYAFVFQLSDGRVVAHPDSSLILKSSLDSLPVGEAVRRAMKDDDVTGNDHGRECQVEYAPIPSTNWGLAVVHDLSAENARLWKARWTVLALALLSAGLALGVVFWIVHPMLVNVRDAVLFAHAVGQGDLSGQLKSDSKDEIGDLVRSLSDMGKNLRRKVALVERVSEKDLSVEVPTDSPRDALGIALGRMVANLREVLLHAGQGASEAETTALNFQRLSAELAGAAEETSAQSGSLSRASEQMNRNVQAVAAGTEEMGASIREIAQSASRATTVASEAVEKATRTNELVAKLGEASKEIGDVVQVIRGIADQTNLLALNATIEAARAGEAGKGFAVVAGEVKELSKATREATEGISSRIQAIQGEMGLAVNSIGEIAQVIQHVNDISHSIASAVEEQTAATGEIAQSIAEASHGVGEITEGLRQVAEAAGHTAHSAAEIRTGSDVLKSQSGKVASAVKAFRLG